MDVLFILILLGLITALLITLLVSAIRQDLRAKRSFILEPTQLPESDPVAAEPEKIGTKKNKKKR